MNPPRPALAHIPQELVAVNDYRALAPQHMTDSAWAYLEGGAQDEHTLDANLARFADLRILPRVLTDLRHAHTRVEILPGQPLAHPVLLAPVAYQKLAHPDGELATALGAAATETCMVVSTQSSTCLDEIARATKGRRWFQLYVQHDRSFTERLIHRAEDAGYEALVLTVDAPVSGLRNREQRTGFSLPPGVEAVNLRALPPIPTSAARPGAGPLFSTGLLHHAPDWGDVERLVRFTSLPVIVKGVLHPLDARRAMDAGACGVIVSNHGGRTLDSAPAALDALPGVVRAVEGRVPVLLDGGIRRGTDVFKALALGARAVLVGRPFMYGLAVAGAAGVAHTLQILRAELETTMALAGCADPEDITPASLWTQTRQDTP